MSKNSDVHNLREERQQEIDAIQQTINEMEIAFNQHDADKLIVISLKTPRGSMLLATGFQGGNKSMKHTRLLRQDHSVAHMLVTRIV